MERGAAWRGFCAAGYGVVVIAAQGLLIPAAQAGDWRATAGINVREEFSDNANQATGGEDRHSDLITTVAPTFSIRGSGGRTSLDLDYSPSKSFYRNDTQGDRFQHGLTANGKIEIWDRIAFIDGQASISRQVTSNTSASSDTEAGQGVNRSDVRSVNLSPYFLHHFGTWVETESRLNLSKVTSDSDTADTVIKRETFNVKSGRRFSQLLWNFSVSDEKTTRSDGEPTIRNFRSNADFTYVINPKVSFLFGGGYERIEDDSLTDKPKGPTWNVGINLRPGRKTSIRATFGDRFDDDVFTLDASHQLSARTRISATFSETIQTSTQEVAQNTSFIGTDANGNLIDTRTGLPFAAGNDNFGLSNNASRQKRFSAQISGSRRRTTFGGQLFWDSRKTDATGIEEIVLGGNVNLGRRLTPRLSSNFGLSYSQTDFGTDDSKFAKDISVSAGLNYTIFKDISGNLNYIHTRRVDHVGGSGMHENAVTIGLNKTF